MVLLQNLGNLRATGSVGDGDDHLFARRILLDLRGVALEQARHNIEARRHDGAHNDEREDGNDGEPTPPLGSARLGPLGLALVGRCGTLRGPGRALGHLACVR